MPVDHVCPHCQNRLAVPRRKVDVEFPCPRCGGANFIDKADYAARKAQAKAARNSNRQPAAGAGAAVGYDDIGAMLGAQGDAGADWQQPAYQYGGYPAYPSGAAAWSAGQTSAPRERVNLEELQDLILVPKQMVLMQVMLFVLLGPIAFGLGYWAASSSATVAEVAKQQAASSQAQSVSLQGEIKVPFGSQPLDAGAVIVALPVEAKVTSKLSARGLRPRDPIDAFAASQEKSIQALGGDVVRADQKGEFHLIVKRPGSYKLLIISHNGLRPAGERPSDIDTKEMSVYFDNVADLLGANQYEWRGIDFQEPMSAMSVRFK
ncbi:MAG: hypothetical protein JSS27_10100 [Planctomycetes bacterium]|nr:hypothetical protein [Planctomycetota bacterium]